MLKKALLGIGIILSSLVLQACNDADVASQNIAKAADNFEVNRRIVFYNGFTGEYILVIEGYCSLEADNAKKISVICKTSPGQFKKHTLGVSDNVTYVMEQLDPVPANVNNYRVVFKPSVIVPDIEIR